MMKMIEKGAVAVAIGKILEDLRFSKSGQSLGYGLWVMDMDNGMDVWSVWSRWHVR